MGWWSDLVGRRRGREPDDGPGSVEPAVPTSTQIVEAVREVQRDVEGRVPAAVTARVNRIARVVEEMAPRLDRLGIGSRQAHTVVATATSYLPEAVGSYLRLPRDFADRRVVAQGKTSLMLLCDQLDLLGSTLAQISDAVSRQDAHALVAHGQFLAEKFGASTLELPDGGPAVAS
ncbi:hypothetical protein [Cellulomonas persica]|uniref:Uncharacterized protein n=1 Tax=Cellulomonas persica TaxID=76861 RepID=A0A510UQ08_9CELL|nr:hypothetical protein [Cellulomonas persica]GEK16748.1 hypothetical protein CPE01_04810 [Cellulomonas persica]